MEKNFPTGEKYLSHEIVLIEEPPIAVLHRHFLMTLERRKGSHVISMPAKKIHAFFAMGIFFLSSLYRL